MTGNAPTGPDPSATYEAPKLLEVGGVYELTLLCWNDKRIGQSDGVKWLDIISVTSC
jgi:hypothetical protein